MKFKRDQNATEKLKRCFNKNENEQNLKKVDEFIVYYSEILLNLIKSHKNIVIYP